MKLLSWLLNYMNKTEDDIPNVGMKLAMEFGKNWLEPIQNRLAKKFPSLTESELDNYNKICQEAMHFGDSLLYDRLVQLEKDGEKITLSKLSEEFEKCMLGKYPWINKSSLTQLFQQALYYAWKDGWDNCII